MHLQYLSRPVAVLGMVVVPPPALLATAMSVFLLSADGVLSAPLLQGQLMGGCCTAAAAASLRAATCRVCNGVQGNFIVNKTKQHKSPHSECMWTPHLLLVTQPRGPFASHKAFPSRPSSYSQLQSLYHARWRTFFSRIQPGHHQHYKHSRRRH